MIEIERVAEVDEAAVLPERCRRRRLWSILSGNQCGKAKQNGDRDAARIICKMGHWCSCIFRWEPTIQLQIQHQDVYARLTKQTEPRAFGALRDHFIYLV